MRSKENDEIIEEEKKIKKHSLLKKILIIFFLLVSTIFIYIKFIATSGFIVKEYGVYSERLPESFNGLKIAHLSDIHFGSIGNKKLNDVVDEVNKMKPDIVVFTGDLYDEYTNLTDEMKQNIIDSLSKIETKLGKYAIIGNHDYSHDGYENLIKSAGFEYLYNTSKILYYNGSEPIEIVGYPSLEKNEANYNIELSNNFKIALIHEGDAFDNIADKDFDLVFAGHSHGGQIRLPFIGALTLPKGAKKYYDEYYKINNTQMYISFGLGQTKYNVRSFNRPSFNIYRLYKKE